MKQTEIPEEVVRRATDLAKKVSFLTEEERQMYAGAIAAAIMWSKSTEKQ